MTTTASLDKQCYNFAVLFTILAIVHLHQPNLANAMSTKKIQITPQLLESRLRGSLWSLFAGDALASPTHWYYGGFPQIQSDYGREGIERYTRPKLHLAGSILNKSDPNGGGRLKFGSRQKGQVTIIGDVINHGKLKYWDPKESYHYHATLQQGENTLEAQLVRVLMKSIVATQGKFDPNHFRQAYIKFMTTEGSHNDTYASTCHRMFFANMIFNQLDPEKCPDNDGHNTDAIDGLILPTVTALAETARQLSQNKFELDKDDFEGDAGRGRNAIRAAAAATASVTRSSKLLERVSEVWADIVTASLIAPNVGEERGGAKNENEMNESLIVAARKLGLSRPRSDGRDQMTACYLSQSLPPTLDMIFKYTQQSTNNDIEERGKICWKALLANANVGGENVHRGSLLGAILGARVGDENLPGELKEGLFHKEEIAKEIDLFVETVMQKTSSDHKEL